MIRLTDIQNYHTAPADVAAIAEAANVKRLVLHHFTPAPDFRVVKNLYKQELKGYSGPVEFSNDGDLFVVEKGFIPHLFHFEPAEKSPDL